MHSIGLCSISKACRNSGKACGLAGAREGSNSNVIHLTRGERVNATQYQVNCLQTVLGGTIDFLWLSFKRPQKNIFSSCGRKAAVPQLG